MARRRKGAESGQATLEVALTLPVLALLLAALVEVGLIVADQGRLWLAAREAARVAVVDPDLDDIRTAAARSGLAPLEIEVHPEADTRRRGDPLTVKLLYRPRSDVPLVGRLVANLSLRAEATMRIEEP